MTIVKESADYYFADIKPGTVFAVKENIFMAVEPIINHDIGLELNAVNLETGNLLYFSEDDFVQLVDAELSIKFC